MDDVSYDWSCRSAGIVTDDDSLRGCKQGATDAPCVAQSVLTFSLCYIKPMQRRDAPVNANTSQVAVPSCQNTWHCTFLGLYVSYQHFSSGGKFSIWVRMNGGRRWVASKPLTTIHTGICSCDCSKKKQENF